MVDKHHTVKRQRMHIRRSAFFINQIVEVNTAQFLVPYKKKAP